MSEQPSAIVQTFFRRRWPDGFTCPSCAHREYYLVSSRNLPLYQCKRCGRQTTVTSGTVMDKTRTPLEKWSAALELLSKDSMNAVQLAAAIGVTHKVAWTILRKLRAAIEEVENARKLEGDIYAGVWALAPRFIWMFLPDRHYRGERVLALFGSTDRQGYPVIKIHSVARSELQAGTKQLTFEGKNRLRSFTTDSRNSRLLWMSRIQMARSPLMSRFHEFNGWLIEQFNGIGTKYLPQYAAEFCFRCNTAARGGSTLEAWYELCFARTIRVSGNERPIMKLA
ncbi:transposase [Paenibacillus sp. TRM 82003]|nr:transposase [Paenibacillus sp. TRM 82003]